MRDDLDLLLDAATAAGDIAARHFRSDPDNWDKGDGQGPVSEADLEIDRMLKAELLAARPDHGWLSEETEDDASRLDAEAVFIVDPIDGTRAFLEGRSTFSHSLAIARSGVVTAAVVHLPMREKTYAAGLETGATLNGAPLSVTARTDVTGSDILAGKWNVEPHLWNAGRAPFRRHFRSSIAYRMCLVGEGRFDGMITLRGTWEWDVAAGSLIVAEAGGQVADWNRTPAQFNNARPVLDGIVAAGPDMCDSIFAALAPREDTTNAAPKTA